jgi:hypothetical protein
LKNQKDVEKMSNTFLKHIAKTENINSDFTDAAINLLYTKNPSLATKLESQLKSIADKYKIERVDASKPYKLLEKSDKPVIPREEFESVFKTVADDLNIPFERRIDIAEEIANEVPTNIKQLEVP